ncbi:unnamed protein product, partial [Coregonus sp. 'balchen']
VKWRGSLRGSSVFLFWMGRWELSWAFPGGVARDQERLRLEDYRCGRQSQHYCSQLTLSSAQAQHTGSFRCRYSQRTRRQSAVYVYVTAVKVTRSGEEARRGERRCITQDSASTVTQDSASTVAQDSASTVAQDSVSTVTQDSVSTDRIRISRFPDQELTPDQRNIVWNSRQGFLIHSPTYFYIGLFSCKTTVNGTTHSLSYLTHRQ